MFKLNKERKMERERKNRRLHEKKNASVRAVSTSLAQKLFNFKAKSIPNAGIIGPLTVDIVEALASSFLKSVENQMLVGGRHYLVQYLE